MKGPPMNCGRAQRWLSASVDGELRDARKRLLEAHLASCSACRRVLAELQVSEHTLDAWVLPSPRAGFTGRFLSRLEGAPARHARRVDWLMARRFAEVAAAAAALILGVLMAISMRGAANPPSEPVPDPAARLYAESFDALPDDSVAARYLALLQETER
ncbi:MAG: zf-HC2 domain-containing protein [Planctomycetota bacterium]